MRRQAGVDGVSIDTRESTCVVAYAKPTKLDFDKIEGAAEDANYVLTGVHLQARGQVVSGICSTCKAKVSYLELQGSKERIELSESAPEGAASLQGNLLGWDGDHPRLEVE
ncbi:MAG: hypothetical protein GY930_17395 [bacterium]|nr:hypothetical protein [bacterium]